MRKELYRWHLNTLQYHDMKMFETLIHKHNIITEGVKSLIFENSHEEQLKPLRGFFAVKEIEGHKKKYFIEESFYTEMPLRANACEELYYRDSSRSKSIILRPLEPTPFRIKPENIWNDTHEFIDMLLPFEHSEPMHWTIHKIMAVMGYVGKTFIGDCSKSEFGKSSIFEVLNNITKKSPVFQPRSVPGVLAQITADGNMVFDEVSDTNSETKRCMENFTLQVGGNKPVYINGALKSKNTKGTYDVSEQSITFLYNTLDQYKTEDNFFDYMFTNNKAIDSRILKLKFDGELKEVFDKDFDLIKAAEDNKMFYIEIAKHLLHLKDLKIRNAYTRRFSAHNMVPKINGRKKRIYDEITWLIDMYCKDATEYKTLIECLNGCINNYRTMIGSNEYHIVMEEYIQDPTPKEPTTTEILKFIRENKAVSATQLEEEFGTDCNTIIEQLTKDQHIFSSQPDKWSVLE